MMIKEEVKPETSKACCLLLAVFLLDFLLNPEDGCSIFLQNIGGLLDDTVLHIS
jgi:hypothetical protein